MNLGKKIRAFRKRYGITQEQFAELIGSTTTTVCFWETGRNRPRIKAVLERIDEVLEGGDPSRVKKIER